MCAVVSMLLDTKLNQNQRALLESEARSAIRNLDGWHLTFVDNHWQLQKAFNTQNFRQALAVAERISRLAEAENHHPTLTLSYHCCSVAWWTHTLQGIHPQDVIMAAATDALLLVD
jgi:4a-hydroxytetrahydrobiopterin dehydratase